MHTVFRGVVLAALVASPLAWMRVDLRARDAEAMARAAGALLESLTAEQRARMVFAFTDAERLNWHFIPRARLGLPLKAMTASQRALVTRLLESGLSQRGHLAASTIIELELVLRELGGDPVVRDPEQYFVSVFGTPGVVPWGWRFEGHHLSLNFTLLENANVVWAPSFFGANPAEVRSGSRQGLRALGPEEDVARALVLTLDSAQRSKAIIAVTAPQDIVTGNALEISPLEPVGIPVGELRPDQAAALRRLIDVYLTRMTDGLAAQRRTALERSDMSRVTFAWAGSTERGRPHYYRVQGPTFLIEYDNTQNNANHIHSVWRDFTGEFGRGRVARDPLREHYRQVPH